MTDHDLRRHECPDKLAPLALFSIATVNNHHEMALDRQIRLVLSETTLSRVHDKTSRKTYLVQRISAGCG